MPWRLVNVPSTSAQAASGSATCAASTSSIRVRQPMTTSALSLSSGTAARAVADRARRRSPSTSSAVTAPAASGRCARSSRLFRRPAPMAIAPAVLGFLSALTRMSSCQPWSQAGQVRRVTPQCSNASRASSVEILVGGLRREDHADLAGVVVERARAAACRHRPARGPSRPGRRPTRGAARRSACDALVGEATLVAHPVLVDVVVLARHQALDAPARRSGPRCCSRWRSRGRPTASMYSSHARIAKRKSLEVSAPTGQTSTVLSE